MKKLLAISALVALTACTAAQQQNAATLAANAQKQVNNACLVVQPTLADLSASMPGDANLANLTAANAKICTAVASLNVANAKSLIDTVIPQALGLVSLLPIDPATQMTIRIALGAASLALSNWLIVYGQPAATVTPASA
ncbi:hypothetical protein [Burkholderia cepacia]|uniref:hypothetical protein n=1 Tax=Burkholderia cepacia TaxID=292 RepID=UPI001F42A86F|nr:hypothetical protein [Burkholderia cepacia]UIY58085.1 hypothetical protein LZ568_07680 [Burkholderia cepacia]